MKRGWYTAQCCACGVLLDQCLLCVNEADPPVCVCDVCYKEFERATRAGESLQHVRDRMFRAVRW